MPPGSTDNILVITSDISHFVSELLIGQRIASSLVAAHLPADLLS